MYCGSGRHNSEEDMATLLSAFDDEESEEEIVEFVHSAIKNNHTNGGIGENISNRDRPRTVEFDEVDLTSDILSEEPRTAREETNISPTWRFTRTVCLFTSFVGLGIVVAILGPTLLDLKVQTCSELEDLPYLFTLRSVGYLLGSLIGGILFDRFNSYLILSVSCLMAGISVAVTSLGQGIYSLLFIMALQGAALGSLDTGANVLVVFLWQKKAAPYMQALHFMFSVGTFIAPLLTKPFLMTPPPLEPPNFSHNSSLPFVPMDDPSCSELQEDLQIKWAYVLASLPLLFVSVAFLVFSCIKMPYQKPPSPPDQRDSKRGTLDWILTLLVLFFLGTMFFMYVGAEVSYGGYVFSFAVNSRLEFTKQAAANLTAVFWGSMAIFRFLSILIAPYVSSFKMILADLIGSILASLIMTFWSHSSAGIWLGSVLMGASMASLYPSAVIWAEKFMHISGKSISLLINAAAFGEMVLPLITGTILARYGADTFVVAMCIFIFLTFGSFCATIVINKQRTVKRSQAIAAHFQRFRDEDDTEDVRNMPSEEIARLLEHTDDIIRQEMEKESDT